MSMSIGVGVGGWGLNGLVYVPIINTSTYDEKVMIEMMPKIISRPMKEICRAVRMTSTLST